MNAEAPSLSSSLEHLAPWPAGAPLHPLDPAPRGHYQGVHRGILVPLPIAGRDVRPPAKVGPDALRTRPPALFPAVRDAVAHGDAVDEHLGVLPVVADDHLERRQEDRLPLSEDVPLVPTALDVPQHAVAVQVEDDGPLAVSARE